MSGWDKVLGPRKKPLEYGQPEEGFLAPQPRLTFRFVIVIAVGTIAFQELARVTGLNALLNRYVPHWVFGAILVAFGLFIILRPRPKAASRFGTISDGAFFILFGGILLAVGLAIPR